MHSQHIGRIIYWVKLSRKNPRDPAAAACCRNPVFRMQTGRAANGDHIHRVVIQKLAKIAERHATVLARQPFDLLLIDAVDGANFHSGQGTI
jgi:hypothetical protein